MRAASIHLLNVSELLNEPPVRARGFWRALWAFSHRSHYSATERDALQPLYEAAHVAIRDVDADKLIFIEPTTGNSGGDGFVRGQGRLFSDSKTVLASHVCVGVVSSKLIAQVRPQLCQ